MPGINKKQLERLEKIWRNKRLSHAYLFSGPEGVGKFEAVVKFVALVSGFSPEEMVSSGSNPDFVVVKPEIEQKQGKIRKKDISVDQIKEVLHNIGYFAYKAKYKFLVIFEAERMSRGAANSLLKLIEEPAGDVIIILVAHKEQRLLPTLRSRCQQIRFGFASDRDLENELKELYSSEPAEKLKLAAELSFGRINFAKQYIQDEKALEEISSQIENFRTALRGGTAKGFELSESFSSDKEKLLVAMNEWIWYLRNFLKEQIKKGESRGVVGKIFFILESLVKLRFEIETTNVNQRIQLDNFFVQIK